LGVDRLFSAFGGLEFADTFLVISLGTTTVVDLVLNRTFKGGSIKPLLSGVFYSLKFSLEGFIREYHRRYGAKKVFFSGGYAHLFRGILEIPFPVEVGFFDNLTLRGIRRFIETTKGGG